MKLQNGELLPSEAVRCREVYRYFQPTTINAANEHHGPPSSPDSALTSFAQLLALRFNVQRGMISIIDDRHQYFVAESTRSLDVLDNTLHGIGDALWVGTAAVDRQGRLCERTLDLRPDASIDDYPTFTVQDLSLDSRFSHLDFVTGAPNLRFYAGVPLTTPAGINIGSVCIVDDKPREALALDDARFLNSIACAVMQYLAKCRDVDNQKMTARIAQAVQIFNLGGASLDDDTGFQSADAPSAQADMPNVPLELDETNSVALGPTFSRAANLARQALMVDGVVYFDLTGASTNRDRGDANELRRLQPERKELLVDTKGGDTTSESASVSQDASGFSDVSEPSLSSTAPFPGQRGLVENRRAGIHGFSTADRASLAGDLALNSGDFEAVHFRFLQTLVKRYPKGHIFSFWDDNYVVPDEEDDAHRSNSSSHNQKQLAKDSKEAMRLRTYFGSAKQIVFVPIWDTTTMDWISAGIAWSRSETRVFSQKQEQAFLLTLGHSIMAELGRLNVVRSDQAKGNFISSISHELRSPLHGILAGVDFLAESRLDHFQESLVSSVESCGRTLLDTLEHVLYFSRIGQLTANLQNSSAEKTILPQNSNLSSDATIENLKNGPRNLLAQTDVSSITEEALDVVFAGLAYSHPAKGNISDSGQSMINLSSSTRAESDISDWKGLTLSENVVVIVDIVYSDNWQFVVFPGGWKRIVMNLFANSLKFTTEGWVKIRLECISKLKDFSTEPGLSDVPDDPSFSTLKLTVSDSGRGMSQEFIDTKLFVPFAQENSLSPGTGLGMSIVKQITDMMGGSTIAQSIRGKGSEIEVKIPVTKAPAAGIDTSGTSIERSTLPPDMLIEKIRSIGKGRRVALFGFQKETGSPIRREGHRGFTASLERCLVDWFQLEVVAADDWGSSAADVMLVEDDETIIDYIQSGNSKKHTALSVPAESDEPGQPCGPALLILRRQKPKAFLASHEFSEGILDYVKYPLGPWKLGAALLRCFDRLSKREQSADSRIPSSVSDRITRPAKSDNDTPKDAAIDLNALSLGAAHPHISTTASSVQPPSAAAAPTLERGPRRPRVLLVEDNAINLMLLSTYMKKKGFEYKTAVDGLYALEAVQESQEGFDVIFMDISMPRMDGFQSTRAIRKHEQRLMDAHETRSSAPRRPTRIIALTGLSSARDEKEALASGCDVFLVKPIKFAKIEEHLKEWGISTD